MMNTDENSDFADDPFWITGKVLDQHFELEAALIQFSRLFEHTADDRAMVIVGGSFLDLLLEHILRAFFIDDEKEVGELLRPEQPLGPYGGRVRAAYCLGLIPSLVHSDLKLVGKIRNRFAHDLYASFDDPRIAGWCVALQFHQKTYMQPPSGVPPRDLFYVGVQRLVGYLDGAVSIAHGAKREPLQ